MSCYIKQEKGATALFNFDSSNQELLKNILVILFLFSIVSKIIGQPANQINGKIIDSVSGNPLAYVTVTLTGDSSSTITGAISDSSGTYQFRALKPGLYFLSFSRTGYSTYLSPSFSVNDSSQLSFADCSLAPVSKPLSAVMVFSRKPLIEKTADGVIYNVQQDLPAAGGTAIDVLRKTPMVSVGQDENPAIRGSVNIRVFIDNKPSELYASTVADALKQLPAEEIIKVEVILYPSSKYDAEGTDGIINIVTRKNKLNGTSGTLSLKSGPRNNNAGLSLNMRHKKWIFNPDAGGNYYRGNNSSDYTRKDTNQYLLKQSSAWKSGGHTFYSGLNVIYAIDSLKTVYGGYRFRINENRSGPATQNSYFLGDSIVDSFKRNTNRSMGNTVNTFTIGYTGKSGNQHKELKALIFYFNHQGFNNYSLEQFREAVMDYKENFGSLTKNKELSVQIDYTQKLSESTGLEAGIKTANRFTTSENRFEVYQFPSGKFIDDPVRANDFDYKRGVYAVYATLNIAGKTWQIRPGIRYEQTFANATFKNSSLQLPDYKNFIPTILINKSIGKHHLKWSYSRQILRPYISYLNPAISYNDSLNLEYGNPYLLPEITHRYEMGYSGNLNIVFAGASLFYSRNKNSIENIRTAGGTGIFNSTYENIGSKESVGLSGNLSWKTEKFMISANFTWRYMVLSSEALRLSKHGFPFNGSLNISRKFTNGYSADGIVYINSREIRLQGWREGWKFYSLSFNKKMRNDRLTLSLRAETFNRYLTEAFITPAFSQRTITRYQNLFILFGLSFKLGKKEVQVPVTQQAATE